MANAKVRIEVTRSANENTMSVLKRFTRRVSGAGVLRKARSLRYKQRDLSPFKVRKDALRRIERRAQYEKLKKLGKLPTK